VAGRDLKKRTRVDPPLTFYFFTINVLICFYPGVGLMGEVGKSNILYLYLLILIFILGAGKCDASSRIMDSADGWASPWPFHLDPIYKDPNTFQLSVVFQNLGKEKIVILPESTRRIYQGKARGCKNMAHFRALLSILGGVHFYYCWPKK